MKKSFLLLLLLSMWVMICAQNIAVGRNGAVVTTTDGGNTWSDSRPTAGQLIDVVGISKYSTNNWVISQFKSGSGNYIQRTTDGGANYTTLMTNLNGNTNYQQEMAHFGPDTLLLLSRLLTNNAIGSHSYSALTTGMAPLTFATGGNERAPHLGLTKINSKTAFVINASSTPVNSNSEIYRYATKSATAGAYCFTATTGVYEHNHLSGSVRMDANTLFAVGSMNGTSNGVLYRTTDNGTTWSIVSLPSVPAGCALQDIEISPNKQKLVVVGSKNYVAYSNNAGLDWSVSTKTLVPGTVANWTYTKVSFADDNTVIVGGSDQTSTAGSDWYILRSTDGGANFAAVTTLTIDTYTDFTEGVDRRGIYHSIYFVSPTVGYAVMGRADKGKKYEIMKTSDAGATWTLITWATGAKPNVNAVGIINHLSSENDLVVNSLSSGNLWQIDVASSPVVSASIVSKYTANDLRTVYRKSASELYALQSITSASNGSIFKSTDGGLTWTLAATATNGMPMLTITDGFVGGYLGRAYMANADFSILTRTGVLGHFGGNLIDLSSTYKNLPNTSSATIFAIGESGGVFKSTNTGASFTYIGKAEWADYTYTAINAVDANTVYICGYNASDQGVILKTTNGGADWTKVEYSSIGRLNDIEMYNATQGLVVGASGVIMATTDGVNWSSKNSGTTNDLIKVICDESVASSATPTISTTGTLSSVNTTYGTASATPTSFSVSGADMTEGILVTAPMGYEVSLSESSGYDATVTVTGTGAIAATTVYLRLKADANVAGSPYSGNVVLSSDGATSVNVATVSSTVTAAEVSLNPGTGSSATATSYSIEQLANSNIIVLSGEFVIDRATVNAQSVTVAPGAKLSLGANTLIANNGFTLQSDATGTATLTGDNAVANATVQQWVTAGRNWYISPSVTAASYTSLNRGSKVAQWNESSKTWTDVVAGTLTAGRGYIQVANADQGTTGTVNFVGTTNAGNIDVAVSRTESGASRGFNLVGNPYPSYLSWTDFYALPQNANALENSFWFRTKNNSNQYAFTTYNGTSHEVVGGGTVPTDLNSFIPPMQAFWVRVKQNTDDQDANYPNNIASIRFANNMRHHADAVGNSSNNRFKAPANNQRARLRLQLSNGDATDEALLYFDTAAANAFDSYDSPKMLNNSATMPDVYSLASTERLAINGLSGMADNMLLPLGFTLRAAATLNFKVSEMSNFESNQKVYLVDNVRNTQTELFAGAEYSFSIDETTTNNESRFALLFKAPGTTTNSNNIETAVVRAYANAAQQIVIHAPAGSQYVIFNAMGQQLESGTLQSMHETLRRQYAAGIYVVKVNSVAKKIIVE